MEYVGIDLHKKESQICLLTKTGEVIERRIRTESQRVAEVLGGRPRARILVEASTESEWVARCLEALGTRSWRRTRTSRRYIAHGRAPTSGGGRSSAERRWSSRARRTVGAHASGTACRHAHLRRPTRLALHRQYGLVHLRIADSPALADPHRPGRPRCRWTPRS
jgi:hypothetical protein